MHAYVLKCTAVRLNRARHGHDPDSGEDVVTEALGSTATPESGRPEDEVAAKKGRRGGKRGKKGPIGRLALFYRQVVAELRKVVWPTRSQLSTYTTVVIVFVLIVIGLVTVIDYGFENAVKYVFG
ncbi:preprotein translocase subunit SecE [Streptomyces netropsis]|uniref:Protein translocase subunit SecE n=2 Tax=Streptomyces TaxID=1883 RepID=A0A7W7LAR4_STRNE|nr:preprotein translocase subunit SecE [Streptomyces netropsis]MBP2403586.1 preprotein translocase subunit SecE [Streptomyces syringium]GGR23054.1 protein translocase subunit SecE [Streptomyces netropsis]